MNQFLCLGSSSSSSSRIEQQQLVEGAGGGEECRVNTEARDASIPDLNIASTSCEEEEQQQQQQQQEEQQEEEVQQEEEPGSASCARIVVAPPDWLPQGWTVELRTRECGTKDKYYIEPSSGKKFRSKLEVLRYVDTGSSSKRKASANGSGVFGIPPAGSLSSSRPFLDSLNSTKWPAGLDNLRDIIVNGMVAPSPLLPSMQATSLEHVKLPDYWKSTLAGSSNSSTSTTTSSWTDQFKLNLGLGTGLMNGSCASVPGEAASTPHWLDRILNKGPPAPAATSVAAAAQSSSHGSLTGGFVQSPLHYLQNAGAFQNSWLHIKPPTPQSQQPMDYSSRHTASDVKSWSWYEDTKLKSQKSDARFQDFFKKREINLNQAFDPDEDDEELAEAHHREDRAVDPCWLPEARSASASRTLESLWEKAVPITLEHRKLVPQTNGVQCGAHFHEMQQQQQQQPQQQQHQHMAQLHKAKESVHFVDLGVRKATSHKVDRHQEKKRMENLGKTVCQQSLAKILEELKESRTRVSLKRD